MGKNSKQLRKNLLRAELESMRPEICDIPKNAFFLKNFLKR